MSGSPPASSESAESLASSSQVAGASAVHEEPTLPASPATVPLPPAMQKVGGRKTKVRADGVAYTDQKKIIAVHLAFGEKRKRVEAEESLGCKRTALYRWKKAFPFASGIVDIDPGSHHAAFLKLVQGRSDQENLAAFLLPEFSVPLPSSSSGPEANSSAGLQLVSRPDGLGPTAEFGASSMSAELLACLRLVDDGADEITDEERANISTINVEDDVPQGGEDLVSHSLNLGAKLAHTNLAKGTNGLWKGPQRKFVAFWRALARLRAETDEERLAASTLEVLATEQKLITWLNCSVLFRNPTLGYEAIRTHVKAINNLWTQQHLEGRNEHPQPGSGALCGQYLRAVRLHQADLARITNADKFRNSLRDGYDEAGYKAISAWFLRRASDVKNEFAAIRDRFAFLWQHAIMGRSEDLRERELSDMYSAELPHSKPHASTVIVSTQLKSKANRDARPERGVAARHRDVETCAQGALAFYLFYRFHVSGEPVPDFSSREAWYRLKLLVDGSKENIQQGLGISWDVQARLLRQAFADCSISSSHLTHAMRSGGAQFASAAGCTEDAIRKHGRWCGDRLMERYLTTVTLQPIRALSGFSVAGGDYWLPRSMVEPPTTLSAQVFPWVDAKYSEVKARANAGGEADGAALQFLDMMKYLRVVLLQDAVLLKKQHPSLPLWSQQPFTSSAFEQFSRDLDANISSTPSPFDVQVTQLVPALGSALGHVNSELGSLADKVDNLCLRADEQEQRSDVRFEALQRNMGTVTQLLLAAQHGEARINAARTAVAESLKALSALSCQLNSSSLHESGSCSTPPAPLITPLLSAPVNEHILSPSPPSPVLLLPAGEAPQPSAAPASDDLPRAVLPHATAAVAAAASALGVVDDYHLPSVNTVAALWLEWSKGRDGRSSLGDMDEAKDVRLRSSNKVRQQVYRWRKIVSFVRDLGPSAPDSVAQILDKALEARKGGLRLLAEELAQKDGSGRQKWAGIVEDMATSAP